jgi:hypothetical protein
VEPASTAERRGASPGTLARRVTLPAPATQTGAVRRGAASAVRESEIRGPDDSREAELELERETEYFVQPEKAFTRDEIE